MLDQPCQSIIHKQAALCWVDFVTLKPISQQLSKEAEASASRQKMCQETSDH